MEYFEVNNGIIIKDVTNFGLRETLDNGSTFRWDCIGNSFCGVVNNKILVIGYMRNTNNLFIGNINGVEFEDYYKTYFDFDTNYSSLYSELIVNNVELHKYLPKESKLRLVNQDFLESFVSAYISQNNNITRIKQIVFRLCKELGKPIEFMGLHNYTFPTLAQLLELTENDYKELGFGYRAKGMVINLQRLADLNTEDFKEYFSNWSYDEVYIYLNSMYQIGPKVANFIISMSHISKNYEEAFVVDVWIKRALKDIYNINHIDKQWLDEHYTHKALAQQNLFYYYRNK